MHYALGRLLLESQRVDEAIVELRAALEHPPVSAEAYNDLGIALATAGRLDEAATILTQAVQARPDFEEARRNLAAVRAQQQSRGVR